MSQEDGKDDVNKAKTGTAAAADFAVSATYASLSLTTEPADKFQDGTKWKVTGNGSLQLSSPYALNPTKAFVENLGDLPVLYTPQELIIPEDGETQNYSDGTSWAQTGPLSFRMASPYILNPVRKLIELEKSLAESRRQEEYWQTLAYTDDLTGLYNLRKLKQMNTAQGTTVTNDNRHAASNEVTLLFIDLDDFGQINKKYGDAVGDKALVKLSTEIRNALRDNDIAFRKGGDEFIILLRGTDLDHANEIVAKRLEQLLSTGLHLEHEGLHIPIRGSVGVFEYDHSKSPLENIKEADEHMRIVKKQRKLEASRHKPPEATPLAAVAPPAGGPQAQPG